MTSTDIDQLLAEAEQSRSAAADAQRKVAEAQAEHDRREAERRDRNVRIELGYSQQHFNFSDLRRRVHDAENKIVDAIRAGRNPITAYRDYRVVVATGLADLRANGSVINSAATRQRQRIRDQLDGIQQRARALAAEYQQITGNAGSIASPGPAMLAEQQRPDQPRRSLAQWKADVRQWHQEVAIFEGRDLARLSEAELTAVPAPIQHDLGAHRDRVPGVTISDDLLSSAYVSLDQAINAAMALIESEEIDKAQQKRDAEIRKLQQERG